MKKYEVELFDERERFRTIVVQCADPIRIQFEARKQIKAIKRIVKYRTTESSTWIQWKESSNEKTHGTQLSIL